MAKKIKKAKTLKKTINKAAKKVKKTVNKAFKKPVKKTAAKKPVRRTVVKVELKPDRKMFALEIALLDKLQNELFEAIAAKPSTMDFEEIRLFVDNVYMTMNKCATLAKDVKNYLLKKDFDEPITETYNSPA